MKIIAIDPALRRTPLAFFDDAGRLVRTESVRVPRFVGPGADGRPASGFKGNPAVVEAGIRIWAALCLRPWRELFGPASGAGVRFVVEDPYQAGIPGGWRGAATGRWTSGVFGGVVFLIVSRFPDADLRIVPVREWKGSYGFLPTKNRGRKEIEELERQYADAAWPGFPFKNHDQRVAALLGQFTINASRWAS